MPDRCIPEKISDFLVQRPGRWYCDSCIQERLGLRWRQQVQLVTATLAVTQSFARKHAECCTCRHTKQVISVAEPPALKETGPAHSPSPVAPKTREFRPRPKLTLFTQGTRR